MTQLLIKPAISWLLFSVFLLYSVSIFAQTARNNPTQIKGNIEINAQSDNMTAVATGTNSVAKNRVGVVEGVNKGTTRVSVSAKNVTTVSSGNNRKACTTIGGVTNDECK